MSTDGTGSAALVGLIAIVPLVVLMLTSFVKISVVLALLRNALGAPDAPSGLVVLGLSLVLTFFVMAPVGVEMIQAAGATTGPSSSPPRGGASPSNAPGTAPRSTPPAAIPATPLATPPATPSVTPRATPTVAAPATPRATPPTVAVPAPATSLETTPGGDASTSRPTAPAGRETTPLAPPPAASPATNEPVALDLDDAVRKLVPDRYQPQVDAASRALVPLERFLARHADARDRETFVMLAGRTGRAARGDELWVLAPAFLTTELREAFAIAVLIFIPFLVLDLVVSLGLAALGLSATQPQTVALPLKLLLFVAVDGWRLLIDSLLRGYA